MGISANQFWSTSTNGKAMVAVLAQRGNVENVRDICDWLITRHKNDLVSEAKKRNASDEQAKAFAEERVAPMYAEADRLDDRTIWSGAQKIIDHIFFPYFKRGQGVYGQVMKWFADELRNRIQAFPGEVDWNGMQPSKDWMLCKCHPSVRKPHAVSGQCLNCGGMLQVR